MSMPSTLFLARSFPPDVGGAQTLAYARCQAHTPSTAITVLAPATEGDTEFDARQSFAIVRWPYSTRWPAPLRALLLIIAPFLGILYTCWRKKIDTIECSQASAMGFAAALATLFLRKRLVVWALGSDIFQPARTARGRWLLRFVFNRADTIIAISQFTKRGIDALSTGSTSYAAKTAIINPPADQARFRPNLSGDEPRQLHNLNGRTILLTVSRLDTRKGIDTMIRVLPTLVERYPELVYVIVGSGTREPSYHQLAHDLNVTDHVCFAGGVSDEALPDYYAMADIVLLLSQSLPHTGDVEGYGIVLREAGLCAKPVIGSNEGGITDVVANEENGLLVDPRDEDAIIDAIQRLLDDPSLRARLGANGRTRALAPTPWHHVLPPQPPVAPVPATDADRDTINTATTTKRERSELAD